MRRVVGTGVRLAVVGALVGVVGTLGLTRYLSTLLFGVLPRDAASIAGALMLTMFVALAASYFPARRAARIDPAITLRTE